MLNQEIKKLKFREKEIKELIETIEEKINLLQKEKDNSKRIELIDSISSLRNHYLTLYWCSYIGYLKNIKDEKFLKSEDVFGKYDGLYNNAIYKMYEVLDNIDNKEKLIQKYGKRFFDIASNQKILISFNNELLENEKQLRRQYRKLLNSLKVNINNEELSLVRLNKYLQDDNIKIRKEAYDKRYNALISINEELSSIFKELVSTRMEIAKSTNFKNYTDYSYIKMNRIDYTEGDLRIFKDMIIKYFVPLNEKLKKAQAKRLGEGSLSYYNASYLFKDGNAKAKYNLLGIITKLEEIFNAINEEFGSLFKTMISNELIDLEERENKSAGGITTYLPDFKCPIFIKRYMDNSSNFISITHEFGHSLQLYLNKDKHLHENRWPTFDICEIHSTTMELLVSEYIEGIYKEDTTKHLINHFTNLIEILIKTSAVDDFQTEVYKINPSKDEINKLWNSIIKKYYPNGNYNLDYFKKGIQWQVDINRIDDPFYGIDYALATIYAFSFYEHYLTDKEKTIKEFINFCKDGGEISFKEIGSKYNLLNPFKEKDLISLANFLDEKLTSIIEKI